MKEKLKRYLLDIAQDKKKDVLSYLLKVLLTLLSYIYWLGIKIIVFLYRKGILRSYKTQSKIVSVGNITLGGTGKTPIEIYLIRNIFSNNKVCLLASGYSEDELNLIQFNLPSVKLLSGKDRVKLTKEAERLINPDVIIIDDGFQHWRLMRDIDIVVIDALNPFGNNHLIPRGILREPLSHLKRADIFFISKVDAATGNLTNLKERLKKLNPKALIIECRYQPLYLYEVKEDNKIELDRIKNKKVLAFCGIGSPLYFRYTLAKMGIKLDLLIEFMDHYQYKRPDIEEIIKKAKRYNSDCIVTTEKDWMRLNSEVIQMIPSEIKFYVLKIEVEITKGKERLIEYLSNLSCG
ncbi:MAG TPA: tetraacyldisaccharide 4'-kinase [Candidatus Omnitrophica bacterium]|nr:tetraacyldisaccharide 4'-kinase [Candidatus Omnitrophota bacterium]